MAVRGVRNSCEASAVKRRNCSKARCSLPSIAFNTAPSLPNSSSRFWTDSRAPKSCADIFCVSRVIASIGASALRARAYPPKPASNTPRGSPMSRTVVNSRSSRHIACSLWATRRTTMELSRWCGLLASRTRKPFGRRSETGTMSSLASFRVGVLPVPAQGVGEYDRGACLPTTKSRRIYASRDHPLRRDAVAELTTHPVRWRFAPQPSPCLLKGYDRLAPACSGKGKTEMRPHTPQATRPAQPRTRASVVIGHCWVTVSSLFPQHKPNASHGVNQLGVEGLIHFPAKTVDVNVDDVIDWRRASFLPHIARQHFPRNDLPFVPEQIFQKLKLPACQFDVLPPPFRAASHHVHFQISKS